MSDHDLAEREPGSEEVGRELASALKTELAAIEERGRAAAGVPAESCSISLVHTNSIERARQGLLDPEAARDLASLFKILADPTRIRILAALSASELCVCDLGALLGMSQSAVSHQLALLRAMRIVRSRREGKVVWYALDDEHVASLLSLGREHLDEGRAQA